MGAEKSAVFSASGQNPYISMQYAIAWSARRTCSFKEYFVRITAVW
jgi:hypothetical protein